MTKISKDDISLVDVFTCNNCKEDITLFHLKGKYMTINSAIFPMAFGAGGYSLGSSAGIAAFGTAKAASWPFAIVGLFIGAFAVYVAGDTRDSLQCPECGSKIDVHSGGSDPLC